MPLSAECKTRIHEAVKKILLSRLGKFPTLSTANRNAPFHDAFLSAFKDKLSQANVYIEIPYLVALASWMHGLNGSLGTGFESIAHILSGGYKRRFTREFTLKISAQQAEAISNIIVDLKAARRKPDVEEEDQLIMSDIGSNNELINALEFTADNFVETENLIKAYELKSVRPNSGEARGEKTKILYGKAALKRLYPDKEIKFYVAFPFDPTASTPTGYNKDQFLSYLVEGRKFFSPDEVLIGAELWDHLAGAPNTMEQILLVVSETVQMFKRQLTESERE